MNDKHTPETWEVSAEDQQVFVCSRPTVSRGGRTICLLPASSHTTRKETIARARLIAAVPDLLSALRSVRTLFRPKDGLPVDIEANFRRMVQNDPVLAEVNAAIAKATETPATARNPSDAPKTGSGKYFIRENQSGQNRYSP